MKYDGYDALSSKAYRNLCKCTGTDVHLRGASKVRVGLGAWHLISYKTQIASFYEPVGDDAKCVCGEPTLWIDGSAFDYSRTTCRHISLYFEKYVRGISYKKVKDFVFDAGLYETEKIDGVWVVVV